MKISNLKRFMASLLAVVMLFSVVGISPAVFADDAVAPVLKAKSDEVIIKSDMTNEEVSELISKALISNYDELDDATKASLQWEYYERGYTEKGTPSATKHWGTINGNALVTTLNYGFGKAEYYNKPLKDMGADNYQVRLAGTETEATLVWVDKYTSEVVLKTGASITYNMDASVMKEAIINNMVDFEQSRLPEGVTASDFTIEYKYAGSWIDVAGDKILLVDCPQMDADDHQVRVTYNGNDLYKASKASDPQTLTVNKATVKVSVNLVNKIYAGEEIDRSTVYTLDPNDPEIDVYMFFVGVNTNKETCVYLKLSEDQEKVINVISDNLPIKPSLNDRLKEGITLGELKDILNTAVDNEIVMGALKIFGRDTAVKNILEAFNALTSVSDDTIVAIGTPAHAGVYTLTAVATGKNYETADATGSLIVLKNWKGIKLEKNPILSSSNNTMGKNNTITVSEAEALKTGNNLCILTKDDAALNSASAGSIHYWFTGVGKIYAKSTMPTTPGKYIVTASVRGGDFFAFPKTFTFTIVADEA